MFRWLLKWWAPPTPVADSDAQIAASKPHQLHAQTLKDRGTRTYTAPILPSRMAPAVQAHVYSPLELAQRHREALRRQHDEDDEAQRRREASSADSFLTGVVVAEIASSIFSSPDAASVDTSPSVDSSSFDGFSGGDTGGGGGGSDF